MFALFKELASLVFNIIDSGITILNVTSKADCMLVMVYSLQSEYTHVSHPPNPSTDTCNPEFPTLRYCIPVPLGSGHDMFDDYDFSSCPTAPNIRQRLNLKGKERQAEASHV